MIASLGNLSRDLIPGQEPRPGGAPYHAARALRRVDVRAQLYARCALEDRDALVLPVARLGTPVHYVPGESTASFRISYDGDRRAMVMEALGDAWRRTTCRVLRQRRALGSRRPARALRLPGRDTRANRRGGRRVSLDGQGLVRVPETGELRLDEHYDPAVLRHIQVLKLAEEEAEVLGDPAALPVREVLVTHGVRGATVYINGAAERVPAFGIDADPTGAGDAFSIAYVAARAGGLPPAAAARRATPSSRDMLAG